MERLGETHEWGELTLRLLTLAGWTVTVRRLLDDCGVLVHAERDRVVIYRIGGSIAEVASDLFLDAMRRTAHTRRSCVSTPAAPAR